MRALLDLAAPYRCVTCGGRAARPPWCQACEPAAASFSAACPRCGDARAHARCPFADSPITAVIALGPYDGPLGDAVRTAKAAGAWAGWERLGHALGATVAGALTQAPPDAVAWVPADRRRRRRRGRDHARDLAGHVARHLDVPLRDLLVAASRRRDQATLAAPVRRDLPVDAYGPRGGVPPRVLLVDDVVATGATALVCARALAHGGARAVVVAAVCRAGSGGDPSHSPRSPGGRTR